MHPPSPGLVLLTTMGGYALAPGAFDPLTCAGLAVGTGLCVASANAYNQVRHRAPPSALHIATARAPRTLSPASRFPRATPPAAVDRGAL